MKRRRLSGFTLIETATALGVLSILFSVVMINLLGGREKASKTAVSEIFVSDFKSQQLKSMLGDTEGRVSPNSYGIYFSNNSYTLFYGDSYTPADPQNFTVELGDNNTFENVLFPQDSVVFASGSGEIQNYSAFQDSLDIVNTSSGDRKNFRFNRFGVLIDEN